MAWLDPPSLRGCIPRHLPPPPPLPLPKRPSPKTSTQQPGRKGTTSETTSPSISPSASPQLGSQTAPRAPAPLNLKDGDTFIGTATRPQQTALEKQRELKRRQWQGERQEEQEQLGRSPRGGTTSGVPRVSEAAQSPPQPPLLALPLEKPASRDESQPSPSPLAPPRPSSTERALVARVERLERSTLRFYLVAAVPLSALSWRCSKGFPRASAH